VLTNVAGDLHRLREGVPPVDGSRDLSRPELEEYGARRVERLGERDEAQGARQSPAERAGRLGGEQAAERDQSDTGEHGQGRNGQ
jgi:hypothetical protein